MLPYSFHIKLCVCVEGFYFCKTQSTAPVAPPTLISCVHVLLTCTLFFLMRTQGLYSVARSAGAVMFESNVREQFYLSDGEIVTESLFGFSFIPDNATVTKGAVAVGFSCGAPPEPTVSTGEKEMMGEGEGWFGKVAQHMWSSIVQDNIPPNKDFDTHNGPRETKSAQDQMVSVYMYVYMYAYMYVSMYVCMCVCMCVRVCKHYVCIYKSVRVWMCVCVCVHLHGYDTYYITCIWNTQSTRAMLSSLF